VYQGARFGLITMRKAATVVARKNTETDELALLSKGKIPNVTSSTAERSVRIVCKAVLQKI
jgi:hypothetical protein